METTTISPPKREEQKLSNDWRVSPLTLYHSRCLSQQERLPWITASRLNRVPPTAVTATKTRKRTTRTRTTPIQIAGATTMMITMTKIRPEVATRITTTETKATSSKVQVLQWVLLERRKDREESRREGRKREAKKGRKDQRFDWTAPDGSSVMSSLPLKQHWSEREPVIIEMWLKNRIFERVDEMNGIFVCKTPKQQQPSNKNASNTCFLLLSFFL